MRERLGLLWVIAAEVVLFAILAERFLSVDNARELVRSSAELGCLAVAMTFVMKSGGIDLSVGSILGLSAVSVGALCERGWPWPVAAAAGMGVGIVCGCVNGLLIARVHIAPLVATLATMALFRGLAEGATGGYVVYTKFPQPLLALGQGFGLLGAPPQLAVLAVAFGAGAVAVHRCAFGRRLTAVGYAPEAARLAGVPVHRTLLEVYGWSGLAAGVAGVLAAAHVGQAKADMGTGYELAAITVALLGGTAVSGGAGTLGGTALSLAAVAILQNGTALAGFPTELASILLGAVLVASVLLGRRELPAAASSQTLSDEPEMRSSQLAVLVAAILAGALLVAGTNTWLVRTLMESRGEAGRMPPKKVVVAMMPKNKSDPYFVSCRKGAQAAADELGAELLWEGPNDTDAAKQNEVVESWITRGVDVIAASVENRGSLSTVLRKARSRGIPVLTWDADAEPQARDFVVNQATPEGIGQALADEAARVLGGKGKMAIVTATLTAANQNEWIAALRARLAAAHPGVEIVVVRPSDGVREKALTETRNLLRAYPDVRLVCTIAAAAVPGSAEAVKQEGSAAKVIGLSVPSLCRGYVHEGIVESIVLWNTVDLGYLTVRAAVKLKAGELRSGAASLDGGRLGTLEVRGSEILLGKPFRFDKSNIDQFDF